MSLNRRKFLLAAGAAASASSLGVPSPAQEPVQSYTATYPDMLLTHVASRLNALAASWDEQRERIHTASDVETRNAYVRQKFKEMIHGYPERAALSPKTVAVHDRDGYRVENVMFQSLPDFWVTGNLYLPANTKAPCPGVISPCGHYPLARMDPEYQCVYVDLVKAGFVVLAYDPIGQGERRQYWNPQTGQTEVADGSVYEHSMPGHLLLLMGEDLTHYRVWDGMRAIDYLQTRPEVDPQRIACAGHSGGGTLTLFISALDERVKCAVVNEGGTANRWPIAIRSERQVGPADVEQNYFPGAKYGVDMPDLHIAIAPRPLLALIEQYHPAFNHAAGQIHSRYAQLGVADRFATGEANDPHAWTPKLRLATTQWLCRWLRDTPGPNREPDFAIEKQETLYCTPNGSLRYSQIGDTIFSLILKRQASLPPKREWTPAELKNELAMLLRYQGGATPLDPRLLVTTPRKGYSVEKIEFLSEPGIYIPTWVFIPEQKAASYPCWLVFNDAGKQADGMEFGLYERLARMGQMVIACDVRGVGETNPPHSPAGEWPGEFRQLFDVETAITYMTWYADESLFGMRVQDVIRSVDYALGRADVDKRKFRVAGKGAGALWVLCAAVLDERISDLTIEHGLLSYRSLARVDRYTHPTGIFVPGILKHFDLPEVAAGLAGRTLTLVSPVDHMKRPVDFETMRQCYSMTEEAFQRAGAGRFRMLQTSGGLYEAA
ncbi:MAG TPA: alpha/beta hydrolase family protein [Bryobacteraceae bacterium]|nr:alpha/beta hydrolase family protein [Bryobacteraceae bacterium]